MPVNKHNGSYSLAFTVKPLPFFRLLNAFAFDYTFYVIVAMILGAAAMFLAIMFYGANRAATRLKNPPPMRFWVYIPLLFPPAVYGAALGMSLLAVPLFLISNFFPLATFIETIPIDLNLIIRPIDPTTIVPNDSARMGLAFAAMGLYGMHAAARVLFPLKPRVRTSPSTGEMEALDDEEGADESFVPHLWRRSHFMLCALGVDVICIYLIEFSYTNFWGKNIFGMLVGVRFFLKFTEIFCVSFLGVRTSEPLCRLPIIALFSLRGTFFEHFFF